MTTIEVPPIAQCQLLTETQAAALLNVKAQTLSVWRCTKRYALPYVKVGSSIRYRPRDIEKFLQQRTITPEPVMA